MDRDFEPYFFFIRREVASIDRIDGTPWLDIELEENCVGTSSSRGCGFMGQLPMSEIEAVDEATLEYVCVPLASFFLTMAFEFDQKHATGVCVRCPRQHLFSTKAFQLDQRHATAGP